MFLYFWSKKKFNKLCCKFRIWRMFEDPYTRNIHMSSSVLLIWKVRLNFFCSFLLFFPFFP